MLKKKGVILYGNRKIEICDLPLKKLKSNQVLIEIKAAGICGSDLHLYRSNKKKLGGRYGQVIGHEPSGQIIHKGIGVKKFNEGDRVTINHIIGCDNCKYCFQGETVLCSKNKGIAAVGYGGDTNYLILPENSCIPLHKRISYVDGTFVACTGGTAYNAAKLAISGPVRNVAVFGLGPVGISTLLILNKFGVNSIGIDPNDKRRKFAHSIGVKNVKNFDTVKKLINSSINKEGFCSSIETSGSKEAQSRAIDILSPRGLAVYVGLSNGLPTISPEQIIHKQISMRGSKVLSSAMAIEMMNFMVNNKFTFEKLVINKFQLEDAPEAFDMFDKGMPGKFIFLPNP